MKIKLIISKDQDLHLIYPEAIQYFRDWDFDCKKLELRKKGNLQVHDVVNEDYSSHQRRIESNQRIELEIFEFHQDQFDRYKSQDLIKKEIDHLNFIKELSEYNGIINKRITNLQEKLENIDQNNLGLRKNFLYCFNNNFVNTYRWNTNQELTKLIIDYFKDEDLDLYPFIFNNHFSLSDIIEDESLQNLKDLGIDIPLITNLNEKHNELILGNSWEVIYKITITGCEDFEENRHNEDHIAYSVLDNSGVKLNGNEITFTSDYIELEDAQGYEIHPFDEIESIKKRLLKYVNKHIYDEFDEENYGRLPELMDDNEYTVNIVEYDFKDKDKLIK